jgi:2,4-dienoyl-CoA reductase (NADPH2)
VVLATGIAPRRIDLPGIDHPKVCSYLDVLTGRVVPGRRVAIIGAGGIGFDVATFLVHTGSRSESASAHWRAEWGVDLAYTDNRGGLAPAQPQPPAREVWLLQRSPGKPGARLGKTTGWIHRATLKAKQVRLLGGVEYLGIDDTGLRVRIDGEEQVLPADHVVICAGQESFKPLAAELAGGAARVHVIGGAELALELDAKRAIDQGSRLAAAL